uniref:Uncharacterized protein n=1 Tax=viral metagenome TaxID=1070528 RepID=A0A6C0D239_9ZZZZ
MISYTDLVPGKKYYIKTHDKKGYHKEMMFVDHETSFNDNMAPEYHINIIMTFKKEPTDMSIAKYYSFYEDDYYYDQEIIENAQKAREQMEHRALNIILKKLINEEFQWA